MSTIPEIFRNFEDVASTWIQELERYTPEQFLRKPSLEEWSIGQVYRHLLQSANDMQLRNMEECLAGNGTPSTAGRTPAAESIFATGSLPPIQIKVPPSPYYTPRQPESLQSVRREMEHLIDVMRSASERVPGHDPTMTIAHPALGPLNAGEWYWMVAMHFHHHLRQKERLDAWLAEPAMAV